MTVNEQIALLAVLQKHLTLFPKATAKDILKLIHQSSFGCAHLIEDEQKSLSRIMAEANALPLCFGAPLIEDIGGGFCRLNLAVLAENGLSAKTLNRFFTLSSLKSGGGSIEFSQKAAFALRLCSEGYLAISAGELAAELKRYKQSGKAPFSHSEAFKAAYSYAYRVVEKRFCDFLELFCRIDQLLLQKPRVIAAIDGRCGAGKSTLAKMLREVYSCCVIPMDDFFLQPNQRTAKRLSEAGGNLDCERLLSEVLPYLTGQEPFCYRPFDCSLGALTVPREINPTPLTVIEGSYSLHPTLRGYYDLSVFLTVSPDIQRERILLRSGKEMLSRFESEWIPMEENYFCSFAIPDSCDFIFDTGIFTL